MLELLFATAAVIHLGLLYATFRLQGDLAVWLVRLLLCGLIYDNVMLALGTFAIDDAWYVPATVARYTAHALVLPMLIVAGVYIARAAGAGFASKAYALPLAWILAVAGMVYGVATESFNQQFVEEVLYGHSRLVSVHGAPPLATIVTNLLLLGIAAAIWRSSGWKWLFLGCLQIFLINAATATQHWSIISGNLAEIVFAVSWVASLFHFGKRRD